MESYYNLGIVKMTTGESGRGLILKREPKTWKDFCDIVPVINEYYID